MISLEHAVTGGIDMKEKTTNYEEKELRAPSGWAVLFLTIILYLAAIGLLIFCAVNIDEYSFPGTTPE